MGNLRKPFQGVWNIITFNWHFYVLAAAFITILLSALFWTNADWSKFIILSIACVIWPMLVSLLVSWYVYDYSDLYSMKWLNKYKVKPLSILNINAGFDEFSTIIETKFSNASLKVLDFYAALDKKEISITRAQNAYPAYISTESIPLNNVPLENDSSDLVFLILSAHEIRNDDVRAQFFKELKRILQPNGKIIVVEHIRNGYNFFAYTIGFLHFLSFKKWLKTFNDAGLIIYKQESLTPFISLFILQQDGNSF